MIISISAKSIDVGLELMDGSRFLRNGKGPSTEPWRSPCFINAPCRVCTVIWAHSFYFIFAVCHEGMILLLFSYTSDAVKVAFTVTVHDLHDQVV